MMCRILLPIRPCYAQAILNGHKIFEMRRSIPKRKVDKIFMYETAPVSKVVGYIVVKNTLNTDLKSLWKETKETNMLSQKEFYSYYKGLKTGYAYEIESVVRFKRKQSLNKYNIKAAPQGFIYMK